MEELYDVQADPYETVNLADSIAHRSVLHQMRRQHGRWVRRIDDQGRFPEDPKYRLTTRNGEGALLGPDCGAV